MCNDSEAFGTCPLRGILPVIAKKWTLLIITTIGRAGTIRFTELENALAGISPKTLTDTLKVLVSEHLVERHCYAEIPPRVEYSLTEDGAGLREAMLPLLQWASQRDAVRPVVCGLVTRSGNGRSRPFARTGRVPGNPQFTAGSPPARRLKGARSRRTGARPCHSSQSRGR